MKDEDLDYPGMFIKAANVTFKSRVLKRPLERRRLRASATASMAVLTGGSATVKLSRFVSRLHGLHVVLPRSPCLLVGFVDEAEHV